MNKADGVHSTPPTNASALPSHAEIDAKHAQQYRELEDPICNVQKTAELCFLAADHAAEEYAGVPETEYIKVTKRNWQLLRFALYQLEDRSGELLDAYYAKPEAAS